MTKSHNDMLWILMAGRTGGLGSTVYGLRLVFKVLGNGRVTKAVGLLGLWMGFQSWSIVTVRIIRRQQVEVH